jgi:hypothetical protein
MINKAVRDLFFLKLKSLREKPWPQQHAYTTQDEQSVWNFTSQLMIL